MPADELGLTRRFRFALRNLSAARLAYEDEPRDPTRIAALGAARIRLDEARTAMRDERRRLGLDAPWREVPAPVPRVTPPPLWTADRGPDR